MAEGGAHLAKSQESLGEYDADPESVSQTSHILQRVKLDKLAHTKAEEDRRRRTIIIEKKNGSYGFTLQSYGIHYKKEHEVEMITYVDYVEYGGPAYTSGMRQGDVILSINGTDMEKADHKTLVAFIKNCDARMRIVVLFEDCVRKVELHMRYIQLQNLLQTKMNELERTCLKEREIIEGGKWKTHSLPARKKTTQPSSGGTTDATATTTTPTSEETDIMASADQIPIPVTRPISTEDVNLMRQKRSTGHVIAPPVQFMLTYQYLDPRCRYILRPSTSSGSGEYLLANIGPPTRSKSDHHQCYLGQTAPVGQTELSDTLDRGHQHAPDDRYAAMASAKEPKHAAAGNSERKSSKGRHCHGHSCNPCVWHKPDKNVSGGDNVSLDAYDLASPCCNPNCVPTRRRVKHKEHKHKHRDKESSKPQLLRFKARSTEGHPVAEPVAHHHHHHGNGKQDHHHSYDLNAELASHCSLHSCMSSNEYDGANDNTASYSTSVSTDTLFWDPNSETSLIRRQPPLPPKVENTPKPVSGHHHHHRQHRYHIQQATACTTNKTTTQATHKVSDVQMQPPQYLYHKPKSWDNLAMKAFGGYGFGYGYLDKAAPKSNSSLAPALPPKPPVNQSALTMQSHSIPRRNVFGRYSTDVENYAPPPSQFVQEFTTTYVTKSTENLLANYNVSNSSIETACDCIQKTDGRVHECTGYYSHLPKNNSKGANAPIVKNGATPVATVSEITRL